MNGSDLRNATHDQAVDVIRNAANPVHFLIQSLATPPGVRIERRMEVFVCHVVKEKKRTQTVQR